MLHERAVEVLTLGSGEYQRELEVCVGERIRFQKNDRKDKKTGERRWNNNDIGTVVGFKAARGKRGLTLKIKMDEDGRVVEVDTAAFHRLGYAYARTAHSAQGLGAESTYWLARGATIDRNMGLVAMTRTKDNFHAFASPEEAKRLEQALDNWGRKETVKELARRNNARPVAQTVGKPIPTVLGEAEHPTTETVRQIKLQQTAEALDHAAEIKRADRDFGQAMGRWKEHQREELGWVEMELDLLAQPGGDIERYEGLSASADTQMRKAFEVRYRKAKNEQKKLLERQSVLTRANDDAKKQAAMEMSVWFEKDYVGGVAAARRDLSLSKANPWVVASFKHCAIGLRRQALKRQRSLEQQLAAAPSQPDPQAALAMEASVMERARKVRALHSLVDKGQYVGDKQKQRKVVLGVDTETPLDQIDYGESRFPPRDTQTHVDPGAMPSPNGRNPTPAPRKRPGMFPTQPPLPTAPEPPKPSGWGREIDM